MLQSNVWILARFRAFLSGRRINALGLAKCAKGELSFHSDKDRFEHSFKKSGCVRDPMCMHTLTCTHIDLNTQTHTHTGMLLLALPSWLWKLSAKTFVIKIASLWQMCSCLFGSLRMGVLGLGANRTCNLDSGFLWNGVISYVTIISSLPPLNRKCAWNLWPGSEHLTQVWKQWSWSRKSLKNNPSAQEVIVFSYSGSFFCLFVSVDHFMAVCFRSSFSLKNHVSVVRY